MKAQDVILGAIGLCILAVWATAYATISWTFTGEAWPHD